MGVDNSAEVIDWEGALEQVGGEIDFLEELLNDFLSEVDEKFQVISTSIDINVPERKSKIARAAHSIKGTASNLMCPQLRQRALWLEQVTLAAEGIDETKLSTAIASLADAVNNFKEFVKACS